ncbi:hypothetical protein ElyMa_004513300 [Elysia marginata]|uniref:Uncharacterized protein n=1 Tax=Elysia marginata TaxID=1093978 RepID=A0AAV4HP78_9GAST|nr:hypothetical protein ElyMa_004513300 [Elysia marginata]
MHWFWLCINALYHCPTNTIHISFDCIITTVTDSTHITIPRLTIQTSQLTPSLTPALLASPSQTPGCSAPPITLELPTLTSSTENVTSCTWQMWKWYNK